MKYILFLLPLIVLSQRNKEVPEAFEVNELREVRWVKVYETNKSYQENIEALKDYFRIHDFTRELTWKGEEFSGYSNEIEVKPIKGGTPYPPITALIRVQVKDNRYRVIISSIKYNPVQVGINVSGFSMSNSQQVSFEDICLKSGKPEFKTGFAKINFLESYDLYFSEKMTIKNRSSDDDW